MQPSVAGGGLYGECERNVYGSKMYEFARKMRLEALEDKTVLDGFESRSAYSQHLRKQDVSYC